VIATESFCPSLLRGSSRALAQAGLDLLGTVRSATLGLSVPYKAGDEGGSDAGVVGGSMCGGLRLRLKSPNEDLCGSAQDHPHLIAAQGVGYAMRGSHIRQPDAQAEGKTR